MAFYISAFAGIIIAFFAFKQFRIASKKKAIAFFVSESAILIDFDDSLGKDIDVRVRGKAIQKIAVCFLDIRVTGRTTIVEDDFSEPLRISFEGAGEVLLANLDESEQIKELDIRHEGAEVFIEPFLMNHKDRFMIRCLLESEPERVTINSRIRELEKIDQSRPEDTFPNKQVLAVLGRVDGLGSKLEDLYSFVFAMVILAVVVSAIYQMGINRVFESDELLEQESGEVVDAQPADDQLVDDQPSEPGSSTTGVQSPEEPGIED